MVVTKHHVIVYYEFSYQNYTYDRSLESFLCNYNQELKKKSIGNFEINHVTNSTPASSAFVSSVFDEWFEADDFNEALIDFLENSPNHKVIY